jgi:hypothetical protein
MSVGVWVREQGGGGSDECHSLFESYVERVLAPTLSSGQIVVANNLSAHKGERVRELLEARGFKSFYTSTL